MHRMQTTKAISIHALREEGDGDCRMRYQIVYIFLSTPSARRATQGIRGSCVNFIISIHALREEGDGPVFIVIGVCNNFYPRPPRGGRPSKEV